MTQGSWTNKKAKLMLEGYFAMRMAELEFKNICNSLHIKNMEN